MAIQTVVGNTNIDNVNTPLFISVANTTSADSSPIPAVTWTARTLPSSSNWQSVAFGNDILIAVSSTSGTTSAFSVDGITWSGRTMPISASWYAITFGNGKFVATATGNVQTAIYTPDGINWSGSTIGVSGNWRCICFGNNKFVTLSYNSADAAYSSDGITWSGSTMPSNSRWTSVAYDDTLGIFSAVASGTTDAAYSYDGITWSGSTMISNIAWSCIITNKMGRFIAISSAPNNSGTTYSDNGIDWNIGGWLTSSNSWTCGAYGKYYTTEFGRFIVKSVSSASSNWSRDGLVWANITQTSAVHNCVVFAPIPWRSNDSLVINNGSIVTVNTDQKKFWSAITVNDGKLSVLNTSTSTAIRFTTGRSSGAATQGIAPGTGLGVIEVSGNTIEIGIGDNSTGQTITAPYTDYIPCLWVETASGSSEYEIWLNVTGVYGPSLAKFVEGFSAVTTGERGKFFIQIPNPIQDTVIILTGATIYGNSRTIKLSTTSNIYVGATITGTGGIPANAVIEKIVDSNTVEMNLLATTNSSVVTVTIYNPFSQQLTNQIQFGNGINGNVLSTGVRVRIPNIMLTSDTSTKIQALNSSLCMSITMTNGGICSMENCLNDDAYHNFTQAQSLSLKNVGFTIAPVVTEIYDLRIDGMGFGLSPVRRYFATYWFQRDVRDLNGSVLLTMTFVNNAVFNNLVFVVNTLVGGGSITAPVGIFTVGYSDNVTVTNCKFYKLQQYYGGQNAIALSGPVTNSTFTNIECYGCLPVSMITSTNNTFTNLTYASSMSEQIMGYIAGTRYAYDPETGLDFVNGTKYYFKSRTYYTRDRLVYGESQEFSATPFTGTTYFPDYFTCYCNDKTSVSLGWTNRSPVHNNPSYEIYRSTVSGFTASSSNRVFSTNTAATVTWINAGPKPTMTAAAGRTLTFTNNRQITASTGSFITDGYLVNDTLMVSGAILNSGKFTITGVTALTLGVAEGLVTETAYSANAVIKATHAINHPTITATATRTLTFNVGKTITVAGASPGNLLFDGYIVGDVIEISGCVNATNNGTKTISTITATIITVLETLATEATYTANATITGKEILDNTTYYYKLRKYNSAGVYSDSEEQEVYVHDPYVISTNFLLQSRDWTTASWTKSNITPTASIDNSPTSNMSDTAANQLVAQRLVATAGNAYVLQGISTASGSTYTFSVFAAVNQTESFTGCSASITLGDQTTFFTAVSAWQRVSVSYTATGVTTAARINLFNNTDAIMLSLSMLNKGSYVAPPMYTTTAVGVMYSDSRFPTLMRPWCRTYGGETDHSGIEIQFYTSPSSPLLHEMYCSTTKGFTPSLYNRLCNVGGGSEYVLMLYNTSSRNTFTNVTQIGKSFPCGSSYVAYANLACSDNKFINFTVDTYFSVFTNMIYPGLGSNNNFYHNWTVGHYRNYPGITPIFSDNRTSGVVVQNIVMTNAADFVVNNQALNVLVKGMSGAYATPANAAVTYFLGSTNDGIAILYTAVYDTIFNELYFTNTLGALHLLFNASAKSIKPYTILSGNPRFSNTGKLYFEQAGDSIEYTWPHKILGVSGFTSTVLKLNGLDLGTQNDRLEALKVEYSIDNAAYKLAIPANLTGETVSATNGFYFKVRITAMQGMKYGTQTNSFVVGEQIEGTTSGVRAYVTNDFDIGATGTLWLSGVTGLFIAGEAIRRASDKQTRATNVVTNTSFALFPSYSSYIDGLQFFTTIDRTVKYPETIIAAQLELSGLVNSTEVRVYRVSDGIEIAGTEDTSGSTFTYDYTWEGTDILVNIIIYALNYIPVTYSNTTLGQYGVSIPVQQQFDRWFSN